MANQSLSDPDYLSDLSDERPLPDPVELSEALPAKSCDCPEPRRNEDTCHRCGRSLPIDAEEVYSPH